MIEPFEVDQRWYEIVLLGSYATLQRLSPHGERSVPTAANEVYDFSNDAWDIAEIERVIREAERQGLFDWPVSAGKPLP